ncbi:cellulase family glycosylhydrolase [Deinococcus cellulosilyticus]|uniref:Uncharacterized protein n=1 Tax=Deinococcus cellulosilyticus (strain DSM 18568 / NBRC 106333 / KACC 11606 / 5516J-15) TaxID=1223518 RepID=A0A511N6K9_DEIC1|nr:cellulase family glycosylhydrolase [Deinococcus cellulosilyticus]GEM48483.1 hypothetical protein DC3_41180 [Deinococcus cellulosilyticus NBRC 106333 = KACC 11606]
MPQSLRCPTLLLTLALLSACSKVAPEAPSPHKNAASGFYISNGKLVDANGVPFIFQGINHPHAWYNSTTSTAIPAIRGKKANSIRIVLSSGCRGWHKSNATEVKNLIQQARNNNMIAVVEVHDTTGYGEDSSACTLDNAANYWLEVKDALVGNEAYAIVNIGNEPWGNNNVSGWSPAIKSAIQKLRGAGIKNTLMVDAPNWGQDWTGTMRSEALSIFNSDTDRNVIFSVHMYEVYNTAQKVNDYIDAFSNAKLPLVVGEFANTHKGAYVDAATIMASSKSKVNGYMGWSWSGNGSGLEALDMVNSFNASSPTSWGNLIFGDLASSNIATVFNTNPAPTVSFSSPAEGQNFAAGSTVGVAVNASDSNGTVSKVDLYVDGVLKGTDTTAPYTFSVSGLTSGPHTLKATATDNSGASSSATRNITVGTISTETLLYSFEGSTEGWTGNGTRSGPWSVTEWATAGTASLKADVDFGNRGYDLRITQTRNLSGKTTLRARVKHASWGNPGSGITARLFVKTGSSWTWFSSPFQTIGSSSATTLTFNLSGVSSLADVREMGVQFSSPVGSSGQSSIYVDQVTLQ